MFAPEERQAWWAQARCNDGAGTLVTLFFSEQLDDIARAKAICARCPVRRPCLDGALARREPWGVWGGELFFNGRVLAQKRRPGRPRKDPQQEATRLEVTPGAWVAASND